MSVNEVKLKQAVDAFVVRGSGAATCRTFCIGDEDHTLGNALRHVLIKNNSVGFAGYSVPHPSEPIVQIRVQTVAPSKGQVAPTAVEALKTACQTLHSQCDIVLEKLEDLLPEVKEDRVYMEQVLLDEGGYEEGDEDDGGDMEGVEETGIKIEHASD
jgi:DNA-directed RNA polymerases I and III subunit RPAC2